MKIYVASSSWESRKGYLGIVDLLKMAGHEVYAYREQAAAFDWDQVDYAWRGWTMTRFRSMLKHPKVVAAFSHNFDALQWCDALVLLLPCGNDAHLEAGYIAGLGKPVIALLAGEYKCGLMYSLLDTLCVDEDELLARLGYGDAISKGRKKRGEG